MALLFCLFFLLNYVLGIPLRSVPVSSNKVNQHVKKLEKQEPISQQSAPKKPLEKGDEVQPQPFSQQLVAKNQLDKSEELLPDQEEKKGETAIPKSRCKIGEISDVQAYSESLAKLKSQMVTRVKDKEASAVEMKFLANSGSATYFYGCPHYEMEDKAVFSNDIDAWCFGADCQEAYAAGLGDDTEVKRGDDGLPLTVESFYPPGENFVGPVAWKAELKEIYKLVKPQKVSSLDGSFEVDVLDCHSLCMFKSLMLDSDLVQRGAIGKHLGKPGKLSKHLADLEDLYCLMRQCGLTRTDCLTPEQKKQEGVPESKLIPLYTKFFDIYKKYEKKDDLNVFDEPERKEFINKLKKEENKKFFEDVKVIYRWFGDLDESELGVIVAVDPAKSLGPRTMAGPIALWDMIERIKGKQHDFEKGPKTAVPPVKCSELSSPPDKLQSV